MHTKQRILDSAERFFARDGYHNTSLRTITGEAGVNLAAVNYHFGSKEALFEAVLSRRLTPLNTDRLYSIDKVIGEAEKRTAAPLVQDLWVAFLEPMLRFRAETPGSRDFLRLIGRTIHEADPALREVFFKLVGPLFLRLSEGMRRALPHLEEDLLRTRMHFSIGAISYVMCAPPDEPSPLFPAPIREDSDTLVRWLVAFLCAGMEAPL